MLREYNNQGENGNRSLLTYPFVVACIDATLYFFMHIEPCSDNQYKK